MKMLLRIALVLTLLSSCDGFAAKRGGGGKKKAAKKGGGGGGGGFGAPTKSKAAAVSSSDTELQEIILGPAKTVYINVPPNALAPEQMNNQEMIRFASASAGSTARSKLLDEYGSFRGRGDVVWPSSLHLARLVANCPSFVADRRVLDLGCGLGLASLATLLGGPVRLVLCDIDETVLDLALKSCEEMIDVMTDPSIKAVDRLKLDWTDQSTWPQNEGEFDVVLASDVLYDEDAAKYVAETIAHLLLSSEGQTESTDEDSIVRRALIVDPANRENRDAFVLNATRNGLLAEVTPFPGLEEEFVLINVTPAV